MPRLGKPRQDLGQCRVHGEDGVRGPDGQVCEHLVVLTAGGSSGNLQSKRGGRQQVQICLPRWFREVIPLHRA